MSLIDEILKSRGYSSKQAREAFLNPDYAKEKHDPFLLPDMEKAIGRLVKAKTKNEKVVIYGDYDIDGLTASTVLLDSFEKFGIDASVFIPNRFVEGYGLSSSALEGLVENGAQLVVTVDCGSLSFAEVEFANSLGLDVIVTDHHTVSETIPDAVAVVNPKRSGHKYPFVDLAGVGVAFKLVQALQTRLAGLPDGQEKWLLDLVAFGTVCDVVDLTGENRANVYWGLQVLRKSKRPGFKLLAAVSRVDIATVTARTLGFVFGPRLNASGRLKTAQVALDLLNAKDAKSALAFAQQLEDLNAERRAEQDRIFVEAKKQVVETEGDRVIVVSGASWSHGIIGIVAAKLLETYHKPAFVLQELEDGTAKGSARSFGDFSAVEAIRATSSLLIKGGGHKLAAGLTLEAKNIEPWRAEVNRFYDNLKLVDQEKHLLPIADVVVPNFSELDETLVEQLSTLEPYGKGNPEPVFRVVSAVVASRKTMGERLQHVSYEFINPSESKGQVFHRQGLMRMVAWNASDKFVAEPGEVADVWFTLGLNEWKGRRAVEGKLLRLEEFSP